MNRTLHQTLRVFAPCLLLAALPCWAADDGAADLLRPSPESEIPQDSLDLDHTAEAVFGFPLSTDQLAATRTWNTKSHAWWTNPTREAAARSLVGNLYLLAGSTQSPQDLQAMLRASDQFFGAELVAAKNAEWADQESGGTPPANHEIVVSFGKRPDLASLHLAILHTALAFRDATPKTRHWLFAEIFPEIAKDSDSSAEIDPEAGEPLDISAFEAAVEAYADDYEQLLEQRRQVLVDAFFQFHVDQQGQFFDRPAFETLELRGFQAEEEALVAATQTFLDNLPSLDDFTGDDLRRMLIEHTVTHHLTGGRVRLFVPTLETREAQAAELAAGMTGASS